MNTLQKNKLTNKELSELYTSEELLESYFVHEARYRLNEIHEQSEKMVEELEDDVIEMMIDETENFFKNDYVDERIEEIIENYKKENKK